MENLLTTFRSTLISEIETLRSRMIETGISKGLTHQETIELSQQLDKLLNQYQKM